MAEMYLRACPRPGLPGIVPGLRGLIILSGAWFFATAGQAASTQAVSNDTEGNPVTLASSTATVGPAIVANPVSRLAQIGGNVSLSVVASGSPTLTYQWRFNNTAIPASSNATATSATLVLNNLTAGKFGSYSVTVTNPAGTVTSTTAALQLDSVGDGIPDSYKQAHFGANWATDPNSAANADPDGDGFTNAEEYADGTDPNSATSHFFRLTVYGNALVKPAAPRYAPGTVVTLTALPQGRLQFAGWTVQDLVANTTTASTANPLTLTLNTSYAVTETEVAQPLDQPAVLPSFTANNHNARAESFLVQKDGKLLAGGTFDAVAGVAHVGLVRFNTDGTLDGTFNPVFDNTVVALAQQADGKLLVGGYFGNVNGVYRPYLARLNLTGTLDTTFAPAAGINNFVRNIEVHSSDTQVLVAGNFGTSSAPYSNGVARLNADGTLDSAFATGTGANNTVWGAVWLPNGQVVLGGDFTSFNGTAVNRLVRLNSNGSLDASFTSGADSTVYQVARRSDGDLIVAGNFGTIDNVAHRGVARLRAADGSYDPSVNSGAGLNNGGVGGSGLVLQSDNRVIIGGNFSGYNGSAQANIARINSDGTLDTTYALGGTGLDNPVYGVGLDAAHNTLLGGPFNFINGVARLGIARLKVSNGNLDSGYVVNTSYANATIYALAAQPGGAVVAGGNFNVVNGAFRSGLARLKTDGSLDTAFNAGTGLNDLASTLLLTPDGKTLVGGNFTTVNGTAAAGRVARFNADGSLDPTFQVAGYTDNQVDTLAIQRDGKIVAGGYFSTFDGAQRLRLARLNADGSLDGSFSPAFDNRVASVVVQPDTRILVGGNFANFNGTATGSLVRLNADGTLDTGFTLQNPNSNTYSVVLQPDGKILFGGSFTVLQGSNMLANRIARLNADGTVDPGFHLGGSYGYSGDVYQISQQPDGKIIAVGNYSNASGLSASAGLPRLRADGSADGLVGSGAINNVVFAIATLTDDSIAIGGPFSVADGRSRFDFARYVAQSALKPGTVTVSPAKTDYTAGSVVTLSVTPTPATKTAIGGVTFERSADGFHFSTLAPASSVTGGTTYNLTTTLPPGTSYFRAAVTDSLANLAHSFAAGPFTTPPAVTSALAAAGTVGSPFAYAATATDPLTGFTATGLPAWAAASFDANLGVLALTGTPTAAGTSTITLKPANAAGSGSATLTLTIASQTDAWTQKNFAAAELRDPRVSGLSGDATGAGVSNLLKYALGIPPHQPGVSARMPRVGTLEQDGRSYLTLTYTRDRSATGVALTVQVSDGLSEVWEAGAGHTVEVSRHNNGDGTETVVTRDTVPLTDARQRFIRLQATQISQ